MKLRELAHARAGDKGNVSNIAVFAYDPDHYPHLARHLTVEKVMVHFAHMIHGPVRRFELPHLGALNFVMEEALDGGVTRSLNLDPHGKSLSSLLLDLDIAAPT